MGVLPILFIVGLCEPRDHISCLATPLPSSLTSLPENGTRVGPTAAVERAHSDRARSGSKGSARVSFHPSASKKEGLAARDPFRARQPSLLESRLFGLPLRASNKISRFHLSLSRGTAKVALDCAHRATAASSRGLCEQEGHLAAPLSPLSEQPLHPSLNLIQPLAQVGLKHISFGLHDHALGLDLILKQDQLGKQLLLF